MPLKELGTIEKVSLRKVVAITSSAAVFFAAAGLIYVFGSLSLPKFISIGDKQIKAELAVSDEEKVKGLSGRSGLCADCGLLFVYDGYFIPNFWMKEMRFPIDIIWIRDEMVVGFDKNVPPPQEGEPLATYQPKTFVNYVLEVPANFVDKNDLKIGDKFKF
ncbi:MAG: DUF192 domain-containing protein [Patescibacteria group bacterium]